VPTAASDKTRKVLIFMTVVKGEEIILQAKLNK
jgi:hypothetical protein